MTHGITYLPEVDLIVVLKEGEITEMGTYKELLEKKGAFAEFLVQHLQEVVDEDGGSETGWLRSMGHLRSCYDFCFKMI